MAYLNKGFQDIKLPMDHTTIINTAYERSNAKANNEHKSVITSIKNN